MWLRFEIVCVWLSHLPEVAEEDNANQYEAAHSDWDQQGHVVDFSIHVD